MDPFIRKCEVVRVIDGDTIDVQIDFGFHMKATHRLRLLRVNTPEMKGETKTAGLAAKTFTQEWIEAHKDRGFYIRTEKSDVFGRWLAELMTADGESLNDELLKTGQAVPFKG